MKVSLIISTYNWPAALEASLMTACRQKDHVNYEIIVADDGSTEDTAQTIQRVEQATGKKILHAWHSDTGFRLAMIRNRAVAKATGDYLIFVDGDCLLPPRFIADHVWLAQKGHFVAGSRVQLAPTLTAKLLEDPKNVPDFTRKALIRLWMQRLIRRIHPIIKWPLQSFRYRRPERWQGAVGCNIAVWRSDYEQVNGFDNDFIGWGREDSEFIMRLIFNNVTRKDGKLGSYILHLYHKKGSGVAAPDNESKFQSTIKQKILAAKSGVREISHLE